MGTQKNRLNETVLLSTQNIFKLMGKKIITILCYKTFPINLDIQTIGIMLYVPKSCELVHIQKNQFSLK